MKKLLILTATALSAGAMLSAAQSNQSSNNYQNQQSQQQQSQYKPDPNFKATPHAIMDDEIAKNVHSILASTWISNGYPNVTFDVKNGAVTFRGVVDAKEDKAKIEHSAKKIEGVVSVRNEISVGLPKSKVALNTNTKKNGATAVATSAASKDSAATESDRALNTKIRERLDKIAPLGYETIVIATSNGVVTVTGNLERVQDMQKLSTEIRHVDGVKSVTNKVTAKSHH